eukprot:4259822-Amphidinium_carterae.1
MAGTVVNFGKHRGRSFEWLPSHTSIQGRAARTRVKSVQPFSMGYGTVLCVPKVEGQRCRLQQMGQVAAQCVWADAGVAGATNPMNDAPKPSKDGMRRQWGVGARHNATCVPRFQQDAVAVSAWQIAAGLLEAALHECNHCCCRCRSHAVLTCEERMP